MSERRRYAYFLVAFTVIAIGVRVFTSVPAAFTFGALAIGWPLVGTIVTIDDDLPGGWSNPDGKQVPEWRHLWFWADLLLVRGAITAAIYLVEEQSVGGFRLFPWIAVAISAALGWRPLRRQFDEAGHAA